MLPKNAVQQGIGLPVGGFSAQKHSDEGTLRILTARIREEFDAQSRDIGSTVPAHIGALHTADALFFLNSALGELLDEQQHEDLVEQVREVATRVNGVKGTEMCFIRKGGMSFYVDLHLIVDCDISVRQGHEILHDLKNCVIQELPEISDVLVHVEPFEHQR